MSGTNPPQPNKKRYFQLTDVLTILDDGKANKAAVSPEATAAAPVTAEEKPVEKAEPAAVQAMTQQDTSLVTKLLADLDLKNAEIMRLNNELMQLRYDIKEKDYRMSSIALSEATKDAMILELKASLEGLRTEIGQIKTAAQAPAAPQVVVEVPTPALVIPQVPLVKQEPVQEQAGEPADQPAVIDNPVPMETIIEAPPLQITQIVHAQAQAAVRDETPATQVFGDQISQNPVRPLKEEYNIKEKEDAQEEDVATIFKRLIHARKDDGDSKDEESAPKLRSAKLYDL